MHDLERPISPRRKRVTEANLIEAGIALTLQKLTVKAVAEQLGVSIVAVYNNIEDLHSLKTAVAEEILRRWDFPMPTEADTFEEALMSLSLGLRSLVHRNPGIAHYLVNIGPESPMTIGRIDEVQQRYSTLFELSPMQARWAVTTVAEHAVALAELVHVADPAPEDDAAMLARTDLTLIPLTVDGKVRSAATNFEWSMRAVIMGATTIIDHPRFGLY